ncbi:MAG: TetR/AcrR family transcriptional regulator [Rhizobacter sp.]|jgi:AcrR family transcriptional regulator
MAYVRRRSKAEQTMSAIVAAAMDIGTRRGLQHVTLNAVATTVGITRAGVFARVGSIEELHNRLVDLHQHLVNETMFEPALREPRGLPRLNAIVERWIVFGGDLRAIVLSHLAAASLPAEEVEASGHRLNARLIDSIMAWRQSLQRTVTQAVECGHLQPDTEPEQMVFEIFGILAGYLCDAHRVRDPKGPERARAAYRRLLASYRCSP